MPVIGFLNSASPRGPETYTNSAAASGPSTLGYMH
ncbi:MAG: hypothetical protein QOD29_1507 [Alphaproteobacteria bacterium]|jgi:hypothetical protein|nr:hypothetical protein [Alphaproteobacteria bacterium]